MMDSDLKVNSLLLYIGFGQCFIIETESKLEYSSSKKCKVPHTKTYQPVEDLRATLASPEVQLTSLLDINFNICHVYFIESL